MSYPTDSIVKEDVRDGGIVHLQRTLDTLDDDFSRLDQAINGLAGTFSIFLEDTGTAVDSEPQSRSIIEDATRRVRYLQLRSEHQRSLIERIRETVA